MEEPLTSLGKKTSKRTEKEKLLEEDIVEEPPTSRRVNPQKRVLEKTRQKSVGPAEKKTKADSDSGRSTIMESNKYHLNNSQKENL